MLRKYQVLTAIDKCISVSPHINVQMLENIHEMVCESKITYGIEVWGLSDAWKEKDKQILQEINGTTELCSQWICSDGTW